MRTLARFSRQADPRRHSGLWLVVSLLLWYGTGLSFVSEALSTQSVFPASPQIHTRASRSPSPPILMNSLPHVLDRLDRQLTHLIPKLAAGQPTSEE